MFSVPVSISSVADDSAIGTIAWSNVNNLLADDAPATVTLTTGQVSHYLKMSFIFILPSDMTVAGIRIEIPRLADVAAGVEDTTVIQFRAGSPVGNNLSAGADWPTVQELKAFGGISELWGLSWVLADTDTIAIGLSVTALANVVASVYRPVVTLFYTQKNKVWHSDIG